MLKKILAVAGADWQAALAAAAGSPGALPPISPAGAAEAVTLLAVNPEPFAALVLEEAVCGEWLETLLDLTIGDTDQAVPLLILGPGAARTGTANLQAPVTHESLAAALGQAATAVRPITERLPEPFSHVDSIRTRYQPIIRLRDMRPGSLEILTRVIAKDGTLIGPETIIGAMTNSEYTMSLTAFIVRRVLAEREATSFDRLGLSFAFNLPLDALLNPELFGNLQEVCQGGGIRPEALRLELTESHPVTDVSRTAAVIDRLGAAGFRVALDDISPATPRLDELLGMPFRAFKLDRGVVVGAAGSDPRIAAIQQDFIARITALSVPRGCAVVAEGIETQATLDLMRRLGATHGQGYLFARPLPARALQPWMTSVASRR